MKVLFSILAGFVVLIGTGSTAGIDEIKVRGTLKVAVAPLSPFVIKDPEGNLSGFEIESTNALAEHLGVEIEYVEKPFCELAEAVLSGEADMIASGFSNMPERRRLLEFSLPYHDTEYFVVVTKSAQKKAKTLRGLNRNDISIGYQIGGVSGMVATGEFPGADLRGFSSFSEILDAMEAGDIDGAVLFQPYIDMAKDISGRKFRIPHDYALTRTIEAFATDQDSDELRDALNEWVILRDIEGFWDELEDTWFSDEFAIASAPPADACAASVPVQ